MAFTRRSLLSRGAILVAAGLTAPSFITRTAMALDPTAAAAGGFGLTDPSKQNRILVAVQLSGGNDGINTLIPFGDPNYAKLRPKLAFQPQETLHLSDTVGLHQNLDKLKGLYDQGRVAVLQGVGYPNPNRSHFRSMDIWHSARPDVFERTGWLGRYIEACQCGQQDSVPAISVGDQVNSLFWTDMTLVPAVLQLLGDRAWHFPRFLERVLPRFDVEGEGLAAELRLADWPEPGCTDAIVGAGLRLDAPDGTPLFRDVDVRVPSGGVLVVAGPHRSGRTALLLTLSGRAHADAGVLKVAGLVAPVRDPDIRRRVAVATLTHKNDPAGELRQAFASRAPIVVVDDLDAVSDPVLRDEVRDELRRARRRAHDEERDLTLVASCLDPAALDALLPAGPPVTSLDLAPLEVV